MIGAAAGLALRGRIPVCHALATFLTLRAFEFIRTDVGIARLPVKLVGGVPGFLSDGNGPTHQAIEDIALMRGIPDMQIFCPADEERAARRPARGAASPAPCYVRYNAASRRRWSTRAVRARQGRDALAREGTSPSSPMASWSPEAPRRAQAILRSEGRRCALVQPAHARAARRGRRSLRGRRRDRAPGHPRRPLPGGRPLLDRRRDAGAPSTSRAACCRFAPRRALVQPGRPAPTCSSTKASPAPQIAARIKESCRDGAPQRSTSDVERTSLACANQRVASTPTTRSIAASDALYERAAGLIPGGTQTLAKGPGSTCAASRPSTCTRGKGSHVWDVDGNEYIDLQMGVGPLSLGLLRIRAVDAAIRAQLDDGITFSLVHPLEVEVAELVRERGPERRDGALQQDRLRRHDAPRFAWRAPSPAGKVLCCGYHGWHDWYIAVTDRNRGIPEDVAGADLHVRVQRPRLGRDALDDDTACVILEPIVFEAPSDGFLAELTRAVRRRAARC